MSWFDDNADGQSIPYFDVNQGGTWQPQPVGTPVRMDTGGGGSSIDDAYARLVEVAKREGAAPEASWRDDLARTYQGQGGQGGRSIADIEASIASQQHERGLSRGGQQQTRSASSGSGGPASIGAFDETFRAPTMEEASSRPGFQFKLSEGMKVLDKRSLAGGSYYNPATIKGLRDYVNGAAEANYQDEYDQALNEYGIRRENFLTNETNRFTSQRTNRMDDFTISDADRKFDWGVNSDVWNRERTLNRDAVGDEFNLADLGLRAAGGGAAAGTNYANASGEYITGAGNATGAAAIANGNSSANYYGGVGETLTLAEMLRRKYAA